MTCRSDPGTATYLSECEASMSGEHDWVRDDLSTSGPDAGMREPANIVVTCYNCGASLEQED